MNISKIVVATVVLIGALAFGSANAENFRFGIITPPTQLWTVLSQQFANEIAEKSKGEINISIFPAGQLGSEAAMLQQLQRGTLDFMLITGAELTNHMDSFNALLAPGLIKSSSHGALFLAEGRTPQVLLDRLEKEIGIKGLAYGMGGATHVITNFKAKSLDDLKGRKVRITPSAASIDYNRILGTSPQSIPLTNVYDAFANKQVDAVETQFDGMEVLGLHNRAETLIVSSHTFLPAVVVVSLRTWRKLNDEQKTIVSSLAQDLQGQLLSRQLERDTAAFDAMKDSVEVVYVEPAYYEDIVAEWDMIWEPKIPILKDVRAEAKEFE